MATLYEKYILLRTVGPMICTITENSKVIVQVDSEEGIVSEICDTYEDCIQNLYERLGFSNKEDERQLALNRFARSLNGIEYGCHMFTTEELAMCHAEGWVIVTGFSDSLVEFHGAINDSAVCLNGGTVLFDQQEISMDGPYMLRALWNEEKEGTVIPWQYRTILPHAEFDIMKDGELFCKGMVIMLHSVGIDT